MLILGMAGGAAILGGLWATSRLAIDTNPPASTAVVERGNVIYQANCAVCHGPSGEGESPAWKTPNADGTYPGPPHDSTGHTWHHADQLLFDIVKDGGSRFNSPTFRSRMPASGGTLTDDEIRAVLAYIKTLWGPGEREAQRGVTERAPR